MIKLIVTDMDGTLLNSEKHLPPDFYEVITRLRAQGTAFCIGSGRTWATLQSNFAGHLQDLDFICENGAFVVENGKHTFESVIPHSTVQAIVQTVLEVMHEDMNIMLCGKKGAQLTDYRSNPKLNVLLSRSVIGQTIVPDILAVDDDIFKIAVADLRGPQSMVLPLIKKKFSAQVDTIQSGAYFMDCMNKGVSKGAALRYMQQSMGITPGETMVFGDYYNDVEMLACAQHSFVMGNAPDGMGRYGRYRAKSNDEDGVFDIIRRCVLGKEDFAQVCAQHTKRV